MKWEPLLAMLVLLALGVWLVSSRAHAIDTTPGATTQAFQLGPTKGLIEISGAEGSAEPVFRFRYLDGHTSEPLSAAEFQRVFAIDPSVVAARPGNALFRLLNISTWTSLAWIAIGFLGQMAFFARMMLQWLISERRQQSIVPEAFWWLSLFGGVTLFSYFVWRLDLIGVMGQTSGVVIYARNIRLIRKQQERSERAAGPAPTPVVAPDPPPAQPVAAQLVGAGDRS